MEMAPIDAAADGIEALDDEELVAEDDNNALAE